MADPDATHKEHRAPDEFTRGVWSTDATIDELSERVADLERLLAVERTAGSGQMGRRLGFWYCRTCGLVTTALDIDDGDCCPTCGDVLTLTYADVADEGMALLALVRAARQVPIRKRRNKAAQAAVEAFTTAIVEASSVLDAHFPSWRSASCGGRGGPDG